MSGFNIAEQGHIAFLTLGAFDINTAGLTSNVINMENYSHISFIVRMEATVRAASVVTIESCSAMGGGGTNTAIVFAYYCTAIASTTALGDVLGARTAVTVAATGIVPVAGGQDNLMYVIELESNQLLSGHVGFRIVIADPNAAALATVLCIQSGARYASPQSPTTIN
jgi:hypothetical protein